MPTENLSAIPPQQLAFRIDILGLETRAFVGAEVQRTGVARGVALRPPDLHRPLIGPLVQADLVELFSSWRRPD
jgi:hypothetical protein